MPWRLLTLPLAIHVVTGSESGDAQARAREELVGKTLRVSFGGTEDPYLFKDEVDNQWSGVLADFLEQLRREVGFDLQEVELSNDSIDAVGPNRNDVCSRDVWLNRTDLCVANAWVTVQRLSFAKFLPTLWQETLQMVTERTEDTSFTAKLLQAFKPFDGYLWLAIGIVIVLYALFAWYAEHNDNNRDFPDKTVVGSGLTSLYHGLFGFFWSEPPTRPVTAEGRVLAVGFGFFTLIMLSSYTASLASVLVSDNASPEFIDMQDALQQRAKVCVWDSVLPRAAKLLDGLDELNVSLTSHGDAFDKMTRDVCDVVLVDTIFLAKAQSENSDLHCKKVPMGGPILDINCAWPSADWLVGPLSLFITELVDKGVLDELRQKYSPRVACDEQIDEGEGLDVENVSGVFFIIGAFLVAAGVVHFCKRGVRHGRKSGSFHRMSTSVLRRTTLASSSTSSTPDGAAKEVADRGSAGSDGETKRTSGGETKRTSGGQTKRTSGGETKRTSGVLRLSGRGSVGSESYVDPEDPGHAMVLAFREEKRLREMPFEKALLVIGNAQAQADEELIAALRDIKSHRSEDFELADSLPEAVAAKLHESKMLKHPDNQRAGGRP